MCFCRRGRERRWRSPFPSPDDGGSCFHTVIPRHVRIDPARLAELLQHLIRMPAGEQVRPEVDRIRLLRSRRAMLRSSERSWMRGGRARFRRRMNIGSERRQITRAVGARQRRAKDREHVFERLVVPTVHRFERAPSRPQLGPRARCEGPQLARCSSLHGNARSVGSRASNVSVSRRFALRTTPMTYAPMTIV